MKYLVLVLVLFSCQASSLDLVAGLYTKHLSGTTYHHSERFQVSENWSIQKYSRRKLNESNDLIGIKNNNFTLATYYNSYRKRSVMLAYSPFNHKYLTLDIGAVSGYDSIPAFYSVGIKSKYIRAQLFGGTVLSVVATLPI